MVFGVCLEVRRHYTVTAECIISATIGVITDDGEIKISIDIRKSYCHYPAIRLYSNPKGLIIAPIKISEHLTITAEGCVQASIRVIACKGKIEISIGIRESSGNYFAITLNGYTVGFIIITTEIGYHLAVIVKSSIETTIRIISRNGKICCAPTTGIGKPSRDYFAIGLNGNCKRDIVTVVIKIRKHPTPISKSGIQTPIGVIPSNGKIRCLANAGDGKSRYNYPSVSLNRECKCPVIAASTEVGGYFATIAECVIQTTIGVITDNGEIKIPIHVRKPCHHYLSIRLYSNPEGLIVASTKIGEHLTITAKRCVQTTIRVVACKGKVEISVGIRKSNHNYFTIRLYSDSEGLIIIATKVGRNPTIPRKGIIKTTISVIADEAKSEL